MRAHVPHVALERAMEQAIDAAHHGVRGSNPLVGAAVVDPDGNIVALGHHRGAGTPHAEVMALRRCGLLEPAETSGAVTRPRSLGTANGPAELTLVSTLEPCRHRGRQPACTEMIAAAGIGRVAFGAADPTASAGGGAAVLRAHGIDVVPGVREPECRALNRRWELARAMDRPFVTAHLAQSLDARIAAADGTSQWITGEESRAHTHGVRHRIDAILVGTNTVRIDDPQLTARAADGALAEHQPLRCAMGVTAIDPAARLTRGLAEGEGWRQLRTRDPHAALTELASVVHRGHPVRHVLVEGGQSVLSAFFAADLVDEVFVYYAPMLLGGDRHSLGDIGVPTLGRARRLRPDPAEGGPVTLLGDDVCLHLTPDTPSRSTTDAPPPTSPSTTPPPATSPPATSPPPAGSPHGTASASPDPAHRQEPKHPCSPE